MSHDGNKNTLPSDDKNNKSGAPKQPPEQHRSPMIPENPASQLMCEGGLALPWWCSVVAWVLCFLTIICSVVLTTLYGIQFGNNKSLQWLASLGVSLLESLFISQPFIVSVWLDFQNFLNIID